MLDLLREVPDGYRQARFATACCWVDPRPELVTAAVAYLASEECASSGDVITSAAGYYAKAQVVESAGFAFPPQAEVTPEMFAERYGEIADMSGARPNRSAMHALKKIFTKVRPKRRGRNAG
mgnify:CR=1 FL=1